MGGGEPPDLPMAGNHSTGGQHADHTPSPPPPPRLPCGKLQRKDDIKCRHSFLNGRLFEKLFTL